MTTPNMGLEDVSLSDDIKLKTIPNIDQNFKTIDDKFGNLLGLSENTVSYTWNTDGTLQSEIEKDKNGNVVSTITYTYKNNGDPETKVLVRDGQTITTQYTYDASGNPQSEISTK